MSNNQQQQHPSWNPEMISVEAELQAVERDFYSGKCGAFETADAQQEVASQLNRLKGLENELFSRSKALWDWSNDEQGLWQGAMHRQQQQQSQQQNGGGNQQQQGGSGGAAAGATPSPGAGLNQQQQMTSADQLASLFASRDQALRQVSDTVSQLTSSISICCEVVSQGGVSSSSASAGGNQYNNNNTNTTAYQNRNQQQRGSNQRGNSGAPASRTASGQPSSSANRSSGSKSGNVVG